MLHLLWPTSKSNGYTFLDVEAAEVEAAVNNQPNTYMEDAEYPGSVLPLTPSHLLHGGMLTPLPYNRCDT